MKRLRHVFVFFAMAIAVLVAEPLTAQAGGCGGSSNCGCASTRCSNSMVCWYSSPWSYCVGHNFGSTWTYISTSATCTSGGYQRWRGYCSICCRWYELAIPEGPLGHNWGSWQQYTSTLHRRQCRRCGIYDYGSHTMGGWYDGGDGWHYRHCTQCGYTEKYDFTAPSIYSFTAVPNSWSAGNGTVTITARDRGSGITSIRLVRTNVNSGTVAMVANWSPGGATSTVSFTYTENSEGVFRYSVYVTDGYGNQRSQSSRNIYLDHSDPELTATVNSDWTNVAPTIKSSATDFLAGTSYSGSGLASITIYDDSGNVVASGGSETSYTLQEKYEGEHTWQIVAIDKVGHTVSTALTTRYDITKPGIDGTEITFVKPDGTTVSGYCQDNIIDQHIDDEIARSLNGANKSSGLKSVILYRVTGTNREVIYSDATKKVFSSSDTHSYFDMYYEIQTTEKMASYYEIIVSDFAGNVTKKKLTSQYSLLSWFHTSIDRSSYN